MNKNAKMIKAQNKETNLVAGEIYNGPLPHPDILKGFQEVNSEYPDRIFKMAEEYSASNIRIQERITKANIVIPILGQVFTFLIVIIGMGAGIFFCIKRIFCCINYIHYWRLCSNSYFCYPKYETKINLNIFGLGFRTRNKIVFQEALFEPLLFIFIIFF